MSVPHECFVACWAQQKPWSSQTHCVQRAVAGSPHTSQAQTIGSLRATTRTGVSRTAPICPEWLITRAVAEETIELLQPGVASDRAVHPIHRCAHGLDTNQPSVNRNAVIRGVLQALARCATIAALPVRRPHTPHMPNELCRTIEEVPGVGANAERSAASACDKLAPPTLSEKRSAAATYR